MNNKKEYIELLMNSTSVKQHQQQVERLKSIVGCEPTRLRTKNEQEYVDFIQNTCYKGKTAKELMEKILKSSFTNSKKESTKLIKCFGSLELAAKSWNECCNRATTLITESFKTNQTIINKERNRLLT